MSAWIGYTNPNPCTRPDGGAFTLEAINLSGNGANNGHVQVGWVKRQGWSSPRWYCEFTPNTSGSGAWILIDGQTISATAHKFSMTYSSGVLLWSCAVDDVNKHSRSASFMGFTQGWWLVAQGETNATHAQVGSNTPGKLGYTVMQRKKGSSWIGINISTNNPPFPYGVDEPAAGQMRNWTNAH